MSIEFEELEEPLSLIGSLVVALASFILLLLGSMGFIILGGNPILYYNAKGELVTITQISIGYTLFFIFFVALIILILAILSLARNKMKFKVNVFVAAVLEIILFISLIFSVPGGDEIQPELSSTMVAFVWIGIVGIGIIFVSKRPNLGKESNKHLYQAYGGVLNVIIGIMMIILGIYVLAFDVGSFAGNGTFPDAFDQAYLMDDPRIVSVYSALRATGYVILIGGIIVAAMAVFRNLLTLYLSAAIIAGGILTVTISVIVFFQNWITLDGLFSTRYPLEYQAQLQS